MRWGDMIVFSDLLQYNRVSLTNALLDFIEVKQI